MIVGELRDLARPYVSCHLTLNRLGLAGRIDLLVDTGSDATYLHPAEGMEVGVSFDLLQDRVTSRGIGGSTTYFQEPAIMMFTDHMTRRYYGYRTSVNIAKPENVSGRLPSLLGRDVIRRWWMDYDPTNDRLEFTVRDADFALDIS